MLNPDIIKAERELFNGYPKKRLTNIAAVSRISGGYIAFIVKTMRNITTSTSTLSIYFTAIINVAIRD